MLRTGNVACAVAVAFSLEMAACQPDEGAAERAGKGVDKTAKKMGDQVDRAADKAKNAVDDTKK